MAPISKAQIGSYASILVRKSSDLLRKSITDLPSQSKTIFSRETPLHLGDGVTPPSSIPNRFVFTVFGLIGAGFVIIGFWFFFRAKNGGFYFRETDWDDYKSSVLQRTGRGGKALSNATASTKLGGGSVYHERRPIRPPRRGKKRVMRTKNKQGQMRTQKLKMAESTIQSSEMSEVNSYTDISPMKKIRNKHLESCIGTEMGSVYEGTDDSAMDDLIAYRHEKSARVGGLNTESEASTFGDSTNVSYATASVAPSLHQSAPKADRHSKNLRSGGIRKVVSVSEAQYSQRKSTVERPRSKKPYIDDGNHKKNGSRRVKEKERTSQRRDFSFQNGDDITVISSESGISQREHRRARRKHSVKTSERYNEESEIGSSVVSSDVGTKTYHHPIPELSSVAASSDYISDKRRRRSEYQM